MNHEFNYCNLDYLIIWRIDDDLTAESFCFRWSRYVVENCVMTTSMTRIITQYRFNIDEDFADTTYYLNYHYVKRTIKLIVGCKHSQQLELITTLMKSYTFFHITIILVPARVWPDTEWFTTTEIDRVIEIHPLTSSERKYFSLGCSRLGQVSTQFNSAFWCDMRHVTKTQICSWWRLRFCNDHIRVIRKDTW